MIVNILAAVLAAIPVTLLAQPDGPVRPGGSAVDARVDEALTHLADPDPATRRAGARSLSALVPALLGQPRALPETVLVTRVVPALAHALERETDDEARAAELRLVADLGTASPVGARAIRPVLPAVLARWRVEMERAREDPPARTTLVRLGPAGGPEVLDAVREVLTTKCTLAPSRGTLAQPGGARLVDGTFAAVPCREAMLVLRAVGPAAPVASAGLAAPFLALGGESNGVAVEAARTLAVLGDSGIAILIDAARDRNMDRAERAVIGLAHVMTPAAVEVLAAIVRDTTRDGRSSGAVSQGARIRLRAAMTLGRFGAPLATPALAALTTVANGTGNAAVRRAALTAARAVRAGGGLPQRERLAEDVGAFEPVGPLAPH